MKFYSVLLSFLLCLSSFVTCFSQKAATIDRPKLVIGVVVDQMRQEYLYRYYNRFGENGLKKLIHNGFQFKNAHFNYIPTYTGPGHASVFTGTTPALHGIIGNSWYDKATDSTIYCVEDTSVKGIQKNEKKNYYSPHNLLVTTIGDELKLSNQHTSKTIGIAIKDRSAILPAGHMADAAYWYDKSNGSFITSNYYMKELPGWLKKFNRKKLSDQYLTRTWQTSYPIETYVNSNKDQSPYEDDIIAKRHAIFPYVLPEIKDGKNDYELLTATPFGNDLTTEMAKAIIKGEKLGQRNVTDLLAISYSSTDIAGHKFGPNSVEIEDIYLKFDKNIEDLLNFLDAEIGEGNYTLFLTADHAVADVPQFLIDQKVSAAGYFRLNKLRQAINSELTHYFGDGDWVKKISNNQVFLNMETIKTKRVRQRDVEEKVASFLLTREGISKAYTASTISNGSYDETGPKGALIRGYNPKRSGNVLYILEPGWLQWARKSGTSHGTSYTYDTHVPMLWYGWGIKKGTSVRYHPITDISPTLSILLNIKFPSGCTGQPITEILEK